MLRDSFIYILVLFLFASCVGRQTVVKNEALSIEQNDYAKGFTISHYKDFTQVELKDPWDSTRILQRYILIDREREKLPENMPKGTIVRIPLQRIVVYTSVHANVVELLKKEDKIVGVCEVRYMDSEKILKALSVGEITDLGESTSPNTEMIIDIGADAIIASPFENAGYGPAEKIGVPIIEGADYMENHPLGKVEWLKFYGMLLGAERIADSVYRETCREYLELKKLAASAKTRPRVLLERLYSGLWFVPAGQSYAATMLRDANVNYVFNYIEQAGNIGLSLETVLDKAIDADKWIIKYNIPNGDITYDDLKAENIAYAQFAAFKNKSIYSCNTGKVPYYREVSMHPQRLLKDYIAIFHPELLPNYTPYYFRIME